MKMKGQQQDNFYCKFGGHHGYNTNYFVNYGVIFVSKVARVKTHLILCHARRFQLHLFDLRAHIQQQSEAEAGASE